MAAEKGEIGESMFHSQGGIDCFMTVEKVLEILGDSSATFPAMMAAVQNPHFSGHAPILAGQSWGGVAPTTSRSSSNSATPMNMGSGLGNVSSGNGTSGGLFSDGA